MPNIPNASKYSVDGSNRVYRDGKLVKTRISDSGVFARLYCDDGSVRSLNVAKVTQPNRKPPTTDYIFNKEQARVHDEYPDYAITSYGDIYCIRPPKSGRHASDCYIVPDFLHGPAKKRYVSIRRRNGTRYQVRLAKLVAQVWGSKSKFNPDE